LFEKCKDNIQRVDCSLITIEDFKKRFDDVGVPCIITGCMDEKWGYEKNWTWKAFLNKYRKTPMKIAEDDNEKKIKIPIEKYYKYLLHQRDDSPLYMFQSGFNELEGTSDIIENYKVPKFFEEDFFNYVHYSNRDERRQETTAPLVLDRSEKVRHNSAH